MPRHLNAECLEQINDVPLPACLPAWTLCVSSFPNDDDDDNDHDVDDDENYDTRRNRNTETMNNLKS